MEAEPNFTRILQETYLSETEVESLYEQFQKIADKDGTLSKAKFVQAVGAQCVTKLFVERAYDVFVLNCLERGLKGLDFEAYANGVSSFSPNSSMEEKMFLCFKMFDIHNQDLITPANLKELTQSALEAVGRKVDDALLDGVVERTLRDAHCDGAGIRFAHFKVLFVHSPILIQMLTIPTWEMVKEDEAVTKQVKAASAKLQRRHSSGSVKVRQGKGGEPFLSLRSPTLARQYEATLIRSAENSPREKPEQHRASGGNRRKAGSDSSPSSMSSAASTPRPGHPGAGKHHDAFLAQVSARLAKGIHGRVGSESDRKSKGKGTPSPDVGHRRASLGGRLSAALRRNKERA